ncbi:MAG: WXG100 family type VII secretion target [Mogibacterium sp.]|nr:WXG100 family type VII secretion target [Mogibacterium sp.]
MADIIKVNTKRLGTDAAEIRNNIREIEKQIASLRTHSSVLDGMWDGPSSEAFKMSFASDITALETVVSTLKAINNYEDNAKVKYDRCEQEVSALVNQIRVR